MAFQNIRTDLKPRPVAEKVHQPLYHVGASDLQGSSGTLEKNLNQTLLRCERWNAVLLIDECDVFLEARSSNHLERNELVSSEWWEEAPQVFIFAKWN